MKKPPKDYTPIRINETTWSIDRSFLTPWLIRGDILPNGNDTYKRIKDDPYLKEHKTGHAYIIHSS